MCVAGVSEEDWYHLFRIAEAKGEYVRMDWNGDEPPSEMLDGRFAGALACVRQDWQVVLSFKHTVKPGSRQPHINVLEMRGWQDAHTLKNDPSSSGS